MPETWEEKYHEQEVILEQLQEEIKDLEKDHEIAIKARLMKTYGDAVELMEWIEKNG